MLELPPWERSLGRVEMGREGTGGGRSEGDNP